MGWLVLSRKHGERINIRVNGVPMAIEVTAIDHGRVRLGFDAGPEVEIWRAEIDPNPPDPQADPQTQQDRPRG